MTIHKKKEGGRHALQLSKRDSSLNIRNCVIPMLFMLLFLRIFKNMLLLALFSLAEEIVNFRVIRHISVTLDQRPRVQRELSNIYIYILSITHHEKLITPRKTPLGKLPEIIFSSLESIQDFDGRKKCVVAFYCFETASERYFYITFHRKMDDLGGPLGSSM